MRLGILSLILIATAFGSGYWYNELYTVCKVPIKYKIGSIDSRFDTDHAAIKRIAANAEAIWEEELGVDLFVFDETADLPINLVFDDRQANAVLEAELREDLEAKEGMSESVAAQYEKLISEFRSLKKTYESRVDAYETKLSAYNNTVSEWNAKGGAPKSLVEELERTKSELTKEQEKLEQETRKLNELVRQLNAIGARGNSLISDYNSIVTEYNDRFSEAHEFTQGDFSGEAINIYQFNSDDELAVVLAHEFGHALALEHVENDKSVMYHLMGNQEVGEGISVEDESEYERVCGNPSITVRLLRFFGSLV